MRCPSIRAFNDSADVTSLLEFSGVSHCKTIYRTAGLIPYGSLVNCFSTYYFLPNALWTLPSDWDGTCGVIISNHTAIPSLKAQQSLPGHRVNGGGVMDSLDYLLMYITFSFYFNSVVCRLLSVSY